MRFTTVSHLHPPGIGSGTLPHARPVEDTLQCLPRKTAGLSPLFFPSLHRGQANPYLLCQRLLGATQSCSDFPDIGDTRLSFHHGGLPLACQLSILGTRLALSPTVVNTPFVMVVEKRTEEDTTFLDSPKLSP